VQSNEREIIATVDAILSPWIAHPNPVEQRALLKHYDRFAEWVASHGLRLPVSGHVVAAYLLRLAANGAALPTIKHAAEGIAFGYSVHRAYLDHGPVRAALVLLEAQTSPNRVLN
jgi:hypothetical protein